MTFMIERRVPVYSVADGDQIVWRKVRGSKGDKPLDWTSRREAQAFADLFYAADSKSDVRIVEIIDA